MRLLLLCALALAVVVACDDGETVDPAEPPTSATIAADDRRTASPANGDATATPSLPASTITITHDDGVFFVEVAVTPSERSAGLSGRTSLPEDGGMLFVLDRTRVPSYWMKDTLIPLDFLWLAEDGTVAEITANVQPEPDAASDADLRRYSPSVPVRYVLELNAGAAARAGIAPGDRLQFELPEPA